MWLHVLEKMVAVRPPWNLAQLQQGIDTLVRHQSWPRSSETLWNLLKDAEPHVEQAHHSMWMEGLRCIIRHAAEAWSSAMAALIGNGCLADDKEALATMCDGLRQLQAVGETDKELVGRAHAIAGWKD